VHLCLVYLMPVRPEMAEFCTHVPIRLAQLLKGIASVHVAYQGEVATGMLDMAGVRHHPDDCPPSAGYVRRAVSLARHLRRVGAENRIDIFMNVWAHYALFPIFYASRRLGSKTVGRIAGVPIRGRQADSLLRKLRHLGGRLVEALSLRGADHVVALSEELRRLSIERGGPADRISVHSQGVDTESFHPPDEVRQSDGHVRLLSVGRLQEGKGQADVIRALAAARAAGLDATLTVVGSGPLEELLRWECDRLDIAGSVCFAGEKPHSEIPDVYREADIYVTASEGEGLPNAVLEAQASGVAVVATAIPGHTDLLADGRGLLVPVGDVNGLTEAILALSSDEDLQMRLTAASLEFVEWKHSFSAIRARARKLFETLLS
jgi:glycogen synthase